jgi:translation initiation factor 2B subunit (eIF-2B alpha/beta/delta family)
MRDLGRDRRSSSTTIGLRALDVVEAYLRRLDGPRLPSGMALARRQVAALSSGQPSLTLVRSVAESLDSALSRPDRGGDRTGTRSVLFRRIAELRRGVTSARVAIARTGLRLFPARRSVLTLSYSTEVLAVLRGAHRRGRLGGVLVGESGPRCEGRRLVGDLRRFRIGARPLPLAALERGVREAELAIVGADTIEADGTVVSKVGAYLIALACRDQGKPFYVTAAATKFLALPSVSRPVPPDDRFDSLFDRTPSALVSGYLTESGLFPPGGLASAHRRAVPPGVRGFPARR